MTDRQSISLIISHNLCTGCGICVGVCMKNAISMTVREGRYFPAIDEEKCTNCGLCMKVCSGVGCELQAIGKTVLASATKEDKLVGRFDQCFTGHSTDEDLRYHSASGGMVTQMLIWLLETKRIDGAIVTKFDNSEPLMSKTIIATTKEELVAAKGSKYAPVSLHKAARLIKDAAGTKFVVVGMPCHIQALRKQQAFDKVLREKIVAVFGLYCSCGRTFYLTEHVFKERNIERDRLTYFAYRDEGCLGYMVAKQKRIIRNANSISENGLYNKDEVYKEHYQKYYHPLRSFFIPKRCLFCTDHYARLADISFGDIHIKPFSDDKIGINSVVARTPQMAEWLLLAKADGVITLDELDVETLNKSQGMARRKHARMGAYLKIAKMFGNKVPEYDLELPVNNVSKYMLEYCHTRVQQFIGGHKTLWPLISLLKSKSPIE